MFLTTSKNRGLRQTSPAAVGSNPTSMSETAHGLPVTSITDMTVFLGIRKILLKEQARTIQLTVSIYQHHNVGIDSPFRHRVYRNVDNAL